MTLPAPVEAAVKDAVKTAALLLVVLGAVPAMAQAAGVAHIVVPASVLAYASTAALVLGGLLRFAKEHGITPTSAVAKVARRAK